MDMQQNNWNLSWPFEFIIKTDNYQIVLDLVVQRHVINVGIFIVFWKETAKAVVKKTLPMTKTSFSSELK